MSLKDIINRLEGKTDKKEIIVKPTEDFKSKRDFFEKLSKKSSDVDHSADSEEKKINSNGELSFKEKLKLWKKLDNITSSNKISESSHVKSCETEILHTKQPVSDNKKDVADDTETNHESEKKKKKKDKKDKKDKKEKKDKKKKREES